MQKNNTNKKGNAIAKEKETIKRITPATCKRQKDRSNR